MGDAGMPPARPYAAAPAQTLRSAIGGRDAISRRGCVGRQDLLPLRWERCSRFNGFEQEREGLGNHLLVRQRFAGNPRRRKGGFI